MTPDLSVVGGTSFAPEQLYSDVPGFAASALEYSRATSANVGANSFERAHDEKVSSMSEVTREEIDAKLDAAQARMELKLAGMDAKLDKIVNAIELSSKISSAESKSTKETAEAAKVAAQNAEARAEEARKTGVGTRWTVVATAIAAVGLIAAVLAVYLTAIEVIHSMVSPQQISQPASPSQP